MCEKECVHCRCKQNKNKTVEFANRRSTDNHIRAPLYRGSHLIRVMCQYSASCQDLCPWVVGWAGEQGRRPSVALRTQLPIALRFLHSQDTRSVPLQPSTFSTYQAASSQAEALPHYPPRPDSHICWAPSSHIYPFPGFQAPTLPSCQIFRLS